MYLKPSRIKRAQNGITCSKECASILKGKYMAGEGNHQFGLKGDNNASFVGEVIVNQYGYAMLYVPNHPKADVYGRYREHRYIVETEGNYSDEYFDIINGVKVLKEEYLVHHKDENKLNNNISNLEITTRSKHTTLHNTDKIIHRGTDGRIIGVFKQGELLETPEEDNQQPSNDSNIIEGSTTNSRIQTSNVEDSNANTSALPSIKSTSIQLSLEGLFDNTSDDIV
jgi:hypothetical protein